MNGVDEKINPQTAMSTEKYCGYLVADFSHKSWNKPFKNSKPKFKKVDRGVLRRLRGKF